MGVKTAAPYYKIVPVPNPAVGLEILLTAPGNGAWLVHSLTFILTTSAAVATRRPTLRATDGSSVYWAGASEVTLAAGLALTFSAYPGGYAGASGVAVATLALPQSGLLLLPGHRLESATAAIDVGDQYSAVAALVQEFPNGPRDETLPTVETLTQQRI